MDRQWMYADGRSKEFIDGVHYFLRVAEANKQKGFICCPCNKGKNQKEYSASRTIHFHLFESGFMPSYNCWTSHGEQGVEMEEDEVEDDNILEFAQYAGFEGNQTGEEDRDADYNDVPDDLGQMLQDAKEDCESEKGAHKLDKMLEDHRTSLYPGCEQGHKKLDTTLEFLQWKAKNGVSDKAFGDLLKLVKNILPEGNKLPETMYEAKKIVCPLGLEVQKIHACPNDCILYRGEEYENLEACPICKALRYKIRRDDPDEVDGQLTKKRIPTKWRNIDRKFKDFGKDARNIRFGLSTDGMNPFGVMSSGHSTWPVTMCIYNLPPWLCMKRKYIMMPIIIQGLKQPGNDIDVFLRPLVEDPKLLWKKESVPVWDEDKQEEFNLRALLFVIINDWPALSNLSGQSNKGYKACTHCMDETESTYLNHCRKVVYMGHRRFLAANHPVRKKGKHFEHKADHRMKPKHSQHGKQRPPWLKDLKRTVRKRGPGTPALYTHANTATRPMLEKQLHISRSSTLSGILGRPPHNVRATITKICSFMNAISQKVIDPDRLEALQNDVVQCLVSFELIFPPSFFNIMTHLLCHLVKEIGILGPVFLHNMFPFERYMGVLKKYVRNRARPEASIAKGYGTEEVIEFCVEFIEDLRPIGVPESRHEGRLRGKGTIGRKAIMTVDNNLFRKAHFTVLQQSSLVAPYIEEHLALVRARNIAQDMKSTNQNSAVRIDAMGHDGTTGTYYSAIEEIWELDYGPLKVPLFRCQWVRLTGGGVTIDDGGMTTVNLNKVGYSDEPFVLANDVTQVFYVKDMSSKGKKGKGPDEPKRHVVLPGKRKIVGVEDKTDEDYDQFDGQPPFTVTIDPSILLSNEDTPYSRSDHKEGTTVRRKYVRTTVTADVLP
uniref:OSIGBa0102O13.10 protein n=1 Tax=Oryza sativa TaxID=4530 RepID=Q01MU6_ORYSA|nr:OSIGBa0102O13.10 [Oryza sativa]